MLREYLFHNTKQINEAELSALNILKKSHVHTLTIFGKLWQASVELCKHHPVAGSHVLVANGFEQCKEFQQFQDLRKNVSICIKNPPTL